MVLNWNEIKFILRTVLRWWWVVLIAVSISAGTAFFLTQNETRFYRSQATLQIGSITEGAVSPDQFGLSNALARVYSELARREPVLKPVRESIQLKAPWQYISDRMLETSVAPNGGLLDIYITDTDPNRAARIANAIAEQLVNISPTAPEKIQAEQQQIALQIEEAQAKIDQYKAKIKETSDKRDQAQSASDKKELSDLLAQQNAVLEEEQNTYRTLLQLKDGKATSSLKIFTAATPPTEPMPSKRLVAVGSAGLAGMLLSFLAVFLLERLDNRWKGRRDVEDRFRMADLGFIPIGPPIMIGDSEFAQQRELAVREAHTNILLAASTRGARSLLVSSPHQSEDRASFTIDLAYLFARSGHHVLLVDADTTNSLLTQILLPHNASTDWARMASNARNEIWAHLRPTIIPNVVLLPSRAQDGNGVPAVIPSLRWPDLLQQLQGAADVIIFDGPTALGGADAALLAPLVDGVVLALDPLKDAREDVEHSKARLTHQKETHLLGAVTFMPTGRQSGLRGVRKQLGTAPVLSLPVTAGAQPNNTSLAKKQEQEAIIVTPPPEHSNGNGLATTHNNDGHGTANDTNLANKAPRSGARNQTSGRQSQSSLRRRRRARNGHPDMEAAE